MKRQEWKHDNLEGIDADIEISLKEYGLAWIEGDTEILFYYGINGNCENEYNEFEYTQFDFCSLDKNLDIKKEYDWIDNWDDISRFIGIDFDEWIEYPLTSQIADLLQYYGYENIFGSSYWEGLTYEQVIKGE